MSDIDPDQGPPAPRPACTDFFDCDELVENNNCDEEFMIFNCPVTCKHCENGTLASTTAATPTSDTPVPTTTLSTTTDGCVDLWPADCPAWATPNQFSIIGECIRRPNWAKINCAKSCNRCGEWLGYDGLGATTLYARIPPR